MDLTSVSGERAYSGERRQLHPVADLPGTIAVRDSKDPDGPALIFTPAEWAAFTAGEGR